jgi:class 3 adenylate cyclase
MRIIEPSDFTVQVVDDEAQLVKAISLAIELDTEFKVLGASSPEEALEQIADREVHFFLVDFRMPNMDGVEFLVRTRADHERAYRALLTGQAGLDNVVRGVNEAGIHHYFSKPVDNDTIVSAVRRAYHDLRLRAENDVIKAHFCSYLSENVLRRILDNHTELFRGQRHQVTVLFTDIRGFTRFSEDRAPDEVVTALNEHLERVVTRIAASGGHVDKYLGDGVMALFGGPFASVSDQASAAVACACEIAKTDAGGFTVGVGVATGPVTVGNIGCPLRYDFTAIGSPVNVAARLVAAAEPGQVLLDEATRERLGADVGPFGEIWLELKGMGQRRLFSLDPGYRIASSRR